eukprot:scaffold290968_cov29-Tisochrysis_lutea.AAC.2
MLHYFEEELAEGLDLQDFLKDESRWPAGFALDGPDSEGKYHFVRKESSAQSAKKVKPATVRKAAHARDALVDILEAHKEEIAASAKANDALAAAQARRDEMASKAQAEEASFRARELAHRERTELAALEREKERDLREEKRWEYEVAREEARARREAAVDEERRKWKEEQAKREDARDERQTRMMTCMMQLIEKALSK